MRKIVALTLALCLLGLTCAAAAAEGDLLDRILERGKIIVGTEGNRIKKVSLSDLNIRFGGGITLADLVSQRGSNPFFFSNGAKAAFSQHGEDEGYPEPSAHGLQPAWGLSVSHAEDLRLKNVRLETVSHDERQAIFTHDTRKMRMKNVTTINHDNE